MTSAPEQEAPAEPTPRLAGRRAARYQPKHAKKRSLSPGRTNFWLWVVLFIVSGFVAGTTAAFNAAVGESNSLFGSVALAEPSSQTLTLEGSQVLASVGTLGGVVGGSGTVGVRWRYYWPTGVSSQGNAPTCASAPSTYPSTQDLGSSTTVSKTITYPSTVSGVSTDGRWMCVMSFTTYPNTDPVAPAQQWLSQVGNPFGPVQLGMVLNSVQIQNGGSSASGTLSTGDKIILTFNQAVDATAGRISGNISMCGRNTSNRILVGIACGGSNDTGNPAVTVMYLLPQGFSLGANTNWATTSSWSADSKTLTLTVSSGSLNLSTKCTVTLSLTGCFQASTQFTSNPSTAWESAIGAKALCEAQPAGAPDTGNCFPKTTGRP